VLLDLGAPTNIWGPWHPRYPKEFWRAVKNGWYVHPGGNPVVRCYGYVGNIVAQILRVLDLPEEKVHRQVFYVSDPAGDIREWADAFSRALAGRPARVVPRWVLHSMGWRGCDHRGAGETLSDHQFTLPEHDFGLCRADGENICRSWPGAVFPFPRCCGNGRLA